MTEQLFDLLILGSGSTAFAAAIKAAELGKTAVMTESRIIGGTCVNRGCLPSKDLLEAARIYWEAQHPRFPGLGAKTLDLDFRALIAGKDEVIHSYRKKKYDSIVDESDKIRLVKGHARMAIRIPPRSMASAWSASKSWSRPGAGQRCRGFPASTTCPISPATCSPRTSRWKLIARAALAQFAE